MIDLTLLAFVLTTAIGLASALFAYGMVFHAVKQARYYNSKSFYGFAVVYFVFGMMLTYIFVVMVGVLGVPL